MALRFKLLSSEIIARIADESLNAVSANMAMSLYVYFNLKPVEWKTLKL